jgi:hypothetical protein
MARKSKQDVAKEKAAKQKKIAIGGGVLLVALLAIQGPKTLKMLHPHSAQPAASATTAAATTTPAAAPPNPDSLAAPTLAGSGTSTDTSTTSGQLVSVVPMTVDAGQLRTFEQFASKDPFAEQAPATSPSAGSPSAAGKPGSGSSSKGAAAPPQQGSTGQQPTPAAPPPPPSSGGSSSGSGAAASAAVISLNGELMSVPVNTDFPTSGGVFARAGSVFHLVSVGARTAKIAIAGGSYADGAATVTLQLKTPLTLQNTADGSKYTLILEPQGTVIPAPTGGTASASAPATTTAAPASAVPSSGSGG